jgi:hypothetical protein
MPNGPIKQNNESHNKIGQSIKENTIIGSDQQTQINTTTMNYKL